MVVFPDELGARAGPGPRCGDPCKFRQRRLVRFQDYSHKFAGIQTQQPRLRHKFLYFNVTLAGRGRPFSREPAPGSARKGGRLVCLGLLKAWI